MRLLLCLFSLFFVNSVFSQSSTQLIFSAGAAIDASSKDFLSDTPYGLKGRSLHIASIGLEKQLTNKLGMRLSVSKNTKLLYYKANNKRYHAFSLSNFSIPLMARYKLSVMESKSNWDLIAGIGASMNFYYTLGIGQQTKFNDDLVDSEFVFDNHSAQVPGIIASIGLARNVGSVHNLNLDLVFHSIFPVETNIQSHFEMHTSNVDVDINKTARIKYGMNLIQLNLSYALSLGI